MVDRKIRGMARVEQDGESMLRLAVQILLVCVAIFLVLVVGGVLAIIGLVALFCWFLFRIKNALTPNKDARSTHTMREAPPSGDTAEQGGVKDGEVVGSERAPRGAPMRDVTNG